MLCFHTCMLMCGWIGLSSDRTQWSQSSMDQNKPHQDPLEHDVLRSNSAFYCHSFVCIWTKTKYIFENDAWYMQTLNVALHMNMQDNQIKDEY